MDFTNQNALILLAAGAGLYLLFQKEIKSGFTTGLKFLKDRIRLPSPGPSPGPDPQNFKIHQEFVVPLDGSDIRIVGNTVRLTQEGAIRVCETLHPLIPARSKTMAEKALENSNG